MWTLHALSPSMWYMLRCSTQVLFKEELMPQPQGTQSANRLAQTALQGLLSSRADILK